MTIVVVKEKEIILDFPEKCKIRIEYETLKNGIRYPINFHYEYQTVKYSLELACDYAYLFDIHLRTAMESFESIPDLNELFPNEINLNKGYYGLMILVALILGIHVLFTDDHVAEQTGHDYLVKPCMAMDITNERIMHILPLFTVMKRVGNTIEKEWGRLGYTLGLLFLECFRNDADIDHTEYNTTISMILYQTFERQISKMEERMKRLEQYTE